MAALAVIAGLNVVSVFAFGRVAVVTAETVVGHGTMIEGCRHPVVGGVAEVAGIAAGDMIRRLALRGAPIVAAGTDTTDLVVIDPGHRRPLGVAMAGFAKIGGQHVVGILTVNRLTVMATVAIIRGY